MMIKALVLLLCLAVACEEPEYLQDDHGMVLQPNLTRIHASFRTPFDRPVTFFPFAAPEKWEAVLHEGFIEQENSIGKLRLVRWALSALLAPFRLPTPKDAYDLPVRLAHKLGILNETFPVVYGTATLRWIPSGGYLFIIQSVG